MYFCQNRSLAGSHINILICFSRSIEHYIEVCVRVYRNLIIVIASSG